MQIEAALARAGLWFVLLLLSLAVAVSAKDAGFAAHAVIIGIVSFAMIWITAGRFDPVGGGRTFFKMPDSPSQYDDEIVRWGAIATMFWGVVGLLAGVFIASQMAFPWLNVEPYLNFGRLRPLHTSAVIFAFGGNALLATSFYVVQRTCRTQLALPSLARFVFWGYQLFIVLAATGYLLGVTQSKEYAEPEWYVDLWLTIVWVAYLAVFVATLLKRNEPHIYVANWFYLAFIVTIAMLHVVNNLAVPISFLGSRSYSAFSGVQDALTQWWYGHNAVGFFLTAGFLAMMYYFVPKQAERPIYSYRLSIIHFWSLIFLYIWAGPHHLHYTDWTIGHVHSGALGWNGMITFACLYYLFPRLWGRERMYSLRMINWHFWLATLGIVFYAASMWVAGITQGLMWREYGPDGYLVNSFADTVAALHPMFIMRMTGGLLYLSGALVMSYNVWMTLAGKLRDEAPMTSPSYDPAKDKPIVGSRPAAHPDSVPAE